MKLILTEFSTKHQTDISLKTHATRYSITVIVYWKCRHLNKGVTVRC